MSTAEPVHICLGCDPCPACAAEEAFWTRYEQDEALAQEREAS